MAGWKWVQLETNNAPVIEGFWHLAFDPSIGKIILVFQKDDYLTYETWTFDGENWKYVCTDTRSQCLYEIPGGLVFDENLGRMTDYNICQISQWERGIRLFEQSNDYCWKSRSSFSGTGAFCATYDSNRERTVILGSLPDMLSVIEYDGQNFSQIPLNDWFPPNGYLAFDHARGKTIFFGHRNIYDLTETLEWDGLIWDKIDAPLPSELKESDYGPLSYYPKAEGTVAVIPIKATLLYKNQDWCLLFGADETPGVISLVYFPPFDGVLGFSVRFGYQITTSLLKYSRGHRRPFDKSDE